MCQNPHMRFKAGLFIGLIIGFIIGARAGKERYDRIVAALRSSTKNEKVRQVADFAERSTRKSRASAGSGMVSAAKAVRENSAAQ